MPDVRTPAPTFTVERLKRRTPAPVPTRAPARPLPFDTAEMLGRLESLETRVTQLRAVGRFGPYAFIEDKSEMLRAVRALKDDVARRGLPRN